MSATLHR